MPGLAVTVRVVDRFKSGTGGREVSATELVVCAWHKQQPDVIGVRAQWLTAEIRQLMTVVSDVRGRHAS